MSPEFRPNTPEDNNESTIDQTTLFKKDDDGNLLPIVSQDTIAPSWRELIDKTKEVGLEFLGKNVISIYVTGSVARGVPDGKSSDLDMFAIVHEGISHDDEIQLEEKVKELSDKEINFHAIPVTRLFGDKPKPRMQFIIKLLGTPVHGENLGDLLPDWKTDINTARALTEDIEKHIEKIKKALEETEDDEEVAHLGRKIMKKFIRQAFYHAMIERGVYTSSFETAYVLCSQVYPEKKELLRQAYSICTHPTNDKETVIALINSIGPWVIEETNKLWENN